MKLTNAAIAQPSRFSMNCILKRDYENHEGARRINIYLLSLFFGLLFVFVAADSWRIILTHEGPCDPAEAFAGCVGDAYSTLAVSGVYHTLRMLPSMIFYTGLWLLVVACLLWSDGTPEGSPAYEMTRTFPGIIIPVIFMPWKYVFKNYILAD